MVTTKKSQLTGPQPKSLSPTTQVLGHKKAIRRLADGFTNQSNMP